MSDQAARCLPDAVIERNFGPISDEFLNIGLHSFLKAVQYIGDLPYGRTTNRADYRLVLSEQIGACSGKHALLAALAQELGLRVELVLGIFEMTDENTPSVRHVLNEIGMSSIPEAHCYLMFRDKRFDLTFSSNSQAPYLKFLIEQVIRPSDIVEYKIKFHRDFLKNWLNTDNQDEIEYVWQVRERCIRALSVIKLDLK